MGSRRQLRHGAGERGAVTVMMALSCIALMGIAGLAVDIGLLFKARADLTRTADAAALAGVMSLPNFATANADALAFVAANDPTATATVQQIGGEPKLRVTAVKSVDTVFMRLLGFSRVNVNASAVAGFSGILDLAIVLDETGSMDGQPINDAKSAARQLVGMVLPDSSGNTSVSLAPFKSGYTSQGCRDYNSCVPTNHVVGMTNNVTTLNNAINRLDAEGTTNVCNGLYVASQQITGAGSHSDPRTRKVVVILSDGDNNPQRRSDQRWPSACDAMGNNNNSGASCYSTEGPEANVDRKLYALAQSLKSQGVEIYVVGLSVCGTASSALCDVDDIGIGHDTVADRNLLKCVASSSPGTNDHYFETRNSSDLTSIFRAIGATIATRLIE